MFPRNVGVERWQFKFHPVGTLKMYLLSVVGKKTLQELRMLSTVTLNFHVTKIVMNSGSQLSELYSVSHMSQVSWIVFAIVKIVKCR